jgi:hypothetical protein
MSGKISSTEYLESAHYYVLSKSTSRVEAGKKRKRRQKENFGSVDMLINYADTCV